MKLIEFELVNGEKIYINPAYVQYVCIDDYNYACSILHLEGASVHVKGDPLEVTNKLVRGYSV